MLQEVVLLSPLPGRLSCCTLLSSSSQPCVLPVSCCSGPRLVPAQSSRLASSGASLLGLVRLALGMFLAQPFVSRGIDASHHSPVFLGQLQGLLNLEGKESEREREPCTLHQSVVLTVLLGNGVVRSCCKMGLQRRRQGPGLETQEDTGFLQTRSCGLLHAVQDVGSNPGRPLSSWMTLKDAVSPEDWGLPHSFLRWAGH